MWLVRGLCRVVFFGLIVGLISTAITSDPFMYWFRIGAWSRIALLVLRNEENILYAYG